MLIGQTVLGNSADTAVFETPWLPRFGDECVSTLEVIAISNDTKIEVELHHKNWEDKDDPATQKNGATESETAVQNKTFERSGLKELVRYRLKLVSNGSPNQSMYCHCRMLAPSWVTN